MKKFIAAAITGLTVIASQGYAAEAPPKYQASCFACHGSGVAGAPVSHDKAAWEPRMALGMDAMLASVKKGKGAMPAGGLCMDCTDDEYKALIDFMAK